MAKDYSVFDIVGPNMIGPSSSHTAGAARLGKTASKIAGKPVKEVKFLLHGSFAETYKGHGTDKAIVGGILGFQPDDARIKNSFQLAEEAGVKFEFIKTDLGDSVHPNTVKIEMVLEDGSKSTIMGASIGGGNIKLTEMDGLALDFNGSRSAVVLEIKDIPGAVSFVTGLLAHNNKDIAMMSTNKPARSEYTFVTIETTDKLEADLIDQLRKFEVIAKIIVLDKF
ncbi:L-serine ammonia-lyase, iron-sulfur-dependent subunit beta [Romboutsia sedimentorum]|uniref:L-serine deaminase n=1 Tax=Romboutsia sedimentorum TaxID=1368474 RepID=A0ABT7E7B9_9FIRM|nr:L-serine ammonia-lyase, iron-sulfur-dependent subunit beta [Romboutsia sedimentorum]MDK2562829.1 L-serine ammonia-lyase, iron-sulfur-dependent subunit beta [Romboutsia sedimentorum]MDK2585688.1 L-serine ammonia-lyase, iron-sulfur-dependent subunit beta [Romboutsia sedimentorum]